MKRNRWPAKAAAIVIALCLTAGVMSQTVFAGADSPAPEDYLAELPEATFVVLDGAPEGVPATPEVTDNRQTVPLYVNSGETPIGQCDIINGVPYMNASAFCQALGLPVQVSVGEEYTVTGTGLSLSARGGQPYIICNGRYIYVEGGFRLGDGQLRLPVEILVNCLGVTASWDQVNWRVTVRSTGLMPLVSGAAYYDENDLYWLSRLIYAKAGGQPLEAQISVGSVCVNRLNSDAFPGQDTIYDVVFAKNQFDVAANGMIYMEPDETALLAAKLALEGCDLTGGATYVSEVQDGRECLAHFGELYFTAA